LSILDMLFSVFLCFYGKQKTTETVVFSVVLPFYAL
jgi:hypothetical protein